MNWKVAAFTFCFCFLFVGCVSTRLSLEHQEATASIKEFPEIEKNELFARALNWVARTYNSANNVIQLKDPEGGQIICKGLGSASFDFGFTRYFSYTMIIDIKEGANGGKMRIRYENITAETVGGRAGPEMENSSTTPQSIKR